MACVLNERWCYSEIAAYPGAGPGHLPGAVGRRCGDGGEFCRRGRHRFAGGANRLASNRGSGIGAGTAAAESIADDPAGHTGFAGTEHTGRPGPKRLYRSGHSERRRRSSVDLCGDSGDRPDLLPVAALAAAITSA